MRKPAAPKLAQEKPGHTRQATALVHEANVRLGGAADAGRWDHRGHFFAAAATAMRRILIERARRKQVGEPIAITSSGVPTQTSLPPTRAWGIMQVNTVAAPLLSGPLSPPAFGQARTGR